MSKKAVVLLSGGLDSVFNLYAAHKHWDGEIQAVFFDYGQKAKDSEWKAAKYFCEQLKVELTFIDLKNIFANDPSSLTSNQEVPTDEVDILSEEASRSTAKKVWVSNRNGVFLNVAACLAEKQGAQWIIPGFNAEEAVTFPDNSVDYIEKMNACLKLSTSNGVEVYCFSQKMFKEEIYKNCLQLGVDTQKIWSCYYPGETTCGRCESCQRYERAKAANDK